VIAISLLLLLLPCCLPLFACCLPLFACCLPAVCRYLSAVPRCPPAKGAPAKKRESEPAPRRRRGEILFLYKFTILGGVKQDVFLQRLFLGLFLPFLHVLAAPVLKKGNMKSLAQAPEPIFRIAGGLEFQGERTLGKIGKNFFKFF
jgi:hypothetical protein